MKVTKKTIIQNTVTMRRGRGRFDVFLFYLLGNPLAGKKNKTMERRQMWSWTS